MPRKSGSPIINRQPNSLEHHRLIRSDAPAVSELTSIAVISVTGVCLRQKDNEQQRAKRKTPKQNHSSEKNAQNNTVTAPLGLIIFPAHCYSLPCRIIHALCSDRNCNVSVKGPMQRKRHTNTNNTKTHKCTEPRWCFIHRVTPDWNWWLGILSSLCVIYCWASELLPAHHRKLTSVLVKRNPYITPTTELAGVLLYKWVAFCVWRKQWLIHWHTTLKAFLCFRCSA